MILKYRKGIILSLLLITITSVFLIFNKKDEYKELPKVKLKDTINSNVIAIMVESNYKTEQYTKWENKEFPADGYTLNRIKSGCVDKNGKDVDALTYNESDKTISIKAKQSIYCYLYYDNLFRGKGTEQEPYEINYIEDLVRLSNSVNKDSNNYNSKYFILKRSLDFNTNDSYMKYNDTGFGDINGVSGIEGIKDELTNQEGSGFIPIGKDVGANPTKYFSGTFDGNNNKISGLYINDSVSSENAIGFFGNVKNGVTKNLTINGNIKAKLKNNLGGLIGYIHGGTIDNCHNEADVLSYSDSWGVGGITCSTSEDVIIKNSTNKGNIFNASTTGGIISAIDAGTVTMDNCHNLGKIENNLGGFIGGLVSRIVNNNVKKLVIKNSSNKGELISTSQNNIEKNIGGLVGFASKDIEITNSHNEGIIDVKGIKGLNVGGLIAVLQNVTTITNSYNLGEIKSTTSGIEGNVVGGLIAKINYSDVSRMSKIENSYNKGNIIGGARVGGILGWSSNDLKLIINKCYNTGNLTGQEDSKHQYGVHVGGIVGQSWEGPKVYVLNSYNKGEIISIGHVGGLISDISCNEKESKGIVINSYNSGHLKAKDTAVGIGMIFQNKGGLISNNFYNTGILEGSSKYTVLFNSTSAPINIKNTYYKETSDIKESDKGDIAGAYAMTDDNIKNSDGNDSNSLLYKLNQNVTDLNKAGLSSIDELIGTDLEDYILSNWKIDSETGYPTLDYNLESE